MSGEFPSSAGTGTAAKSARLHYIDWLRTLAMLAIFLFHTNRFFDAGGWHLKNAELSDVSSGVSGFMDLWLMPLFFLLSGVGSWYALKSRSGRQYLIDRVKRLLIPLYTVGVFVVVVPQVYFEWVTNKGYTGTFGEMIPKYFGAIPDKLNHSPLFFNVMYGHLWFLQFLFLISLLTLPLLAYLKGEGGQRLVQRLAEWCSHRGGVFIFILPLALVRVGLESFFEGNITWASFVYYALFFLIGYIVPADGRFTDSFRRTGWVCLVLGVLGWASIGAMFVVYGYEDVMEASFSPLFVLFQFVVSVANWSFVVFILSLGVRYLNFTNGVVRYGNEAVLPFYVVHQTVILSIGWFVIQWSVGIPIKYLTIAAISFVIIVAIYELLIRRINVLRFLFGMKLQRKGGE